MPYGNLHDKAGLFFIAYAASPENFDYMLDRMVGLDKDGHSDDVMKLSECVSGNYWYFPGAAQLTRLSSWGSNMSISGLFPKYEWSYMPRRVYI